MPEPMDRSEVPEGAGRSPRAPRWVKVFVIVSVALLVVLVILLLAGGHGPGQHV